MVWVDAREEETMSLNEIGRLQFDVARLTPRCPLCRETMTYSFEALEFKCEKHPWHRVDTRFDR